VSTETTAGGTTAGGYSAATKLFHWLIVILFALQYSSAIVMTNIGGKDTVLGLNQGAYYNWHKSLGLIALAIAVARLINRKRTTLPDWAPTLTGGEQKYIHRVEQILYTAMFIMPISGYIYVMAGGYGVMFFGVWKLGDPIGKSADLAFYMKWVHILASYMLLIGMIGHIGLVLRHQFYEKDGLLRRMLPGKK